jgi:hypothetical protein
VVVGGSTWVVVSSNSSMLSKLWSLQPRAVKTAVYHCIDSTSQSLSMYYTLLAKWRKLGDTGGFLVNDRQSAYR